MQPEIPAADLVPGRRYRIQHRAQILAPRTGVFLQMFQLPYGTFAQFDRQQGPGRKEQPVTRATYGEIEWSFHMSGESIAMNKATQSGTLYNAIPNNVLYDLKKYGGQRQTRRKHTKGRTRT